jgi:hypothetical protein
MTGSEIEKFLENLKTGKLVAKSPLALHVLQDLIYQGILPKSNIKETDPGTFEYLLPGMIVIDEISVMKESAYAKGLKIHKKVEDNINHPSHYTDGKIEVTDFILDKGLDYCRGHVVRYVCRAGKKDKSKEVEDLKKAQWYLSREITRLEKGE